MLLSGFTQIYNKRILFPYSFLLLKRILAKKNIFYLLIFTQICLIFATLHAFILHPKDYVFQAGYDGIKNYFTYQSYIQQSKAENMFLHANMNYPYKEYIFYTDNTPALALPVRLFSTYIYDIQDFAIPIYHYWLFLGILFSTLLLYKILKRGITQPFILFVAALTLPWLDIQLLRLGIGHLNLSCSWVWLGVMLLCIKWEESGYKNYYSLLIAIYLYIISFIHLYYLPIAMLFVAMLIGFKTLFSFRQKKAWFGAISMGFGVGAAAAAVLATIQIIDKYYAFRSKLPMGYEWDHYKLKISALVTPFHFNHIPFVWKTDDALDYENWGYLGSFLLYGGTILLLLSLFFAAKTLVQKKWTKEISIFTQWLIAIFISSILCALIALGKEFKFHDTERVVHINYGSIFYYLDKYVPSLAQFRCLGRFSWLLFWGANLIFIAIWQAIYDKIQGKSKYLLLLLSIFLWVDMYDRLTFSEKTHGESPFATEKMTEMKAVFEGIDPQKYQAILPIPYYHVGSEIMPFTIDPNEYLCTSSMQASLLTKLPLMANKQSRTAVYQAQQLLSIFTEKKLSDTLRNQLNDKPILALVNRKYITTTDWDIPQRAEASYIYHSSTTILQRNMTFLKRAGDWELYTWYPKIDTFYKPLEVKTLATSKENVLKFALTDTSLAYKWVKIRANMQLSTNDSLPTLTFSIKDNQQKAYVNIVKNIAQKANNELFVNIEQIWRLPAFRSSTDTLFISATNSAGKPLLSQEIHLVQIQ